jgi:deoxyadenosine/deoxycytidine kinase
MNKKIISIEGNIGVGKTTFINIIKERIEKSEIVKEPIDLWKTITNEKDENILQVFYNDVERWGYTFQNLACITRMMCIEENIRESNCEYLFLDRSLGTDKFIFEKILHDNGDISLIEHKIYNLWCDFYSKYVRDFKNELIIYLKCDTTIAYERIMKRGRDEEKNIPFEYLDQVNKYHDNWLNKNNENIVIIDCNKDFEHNMDYQNEIINTINEKLKSHFM